MRIRENYGAMPEAQTLESRHRVFKSWPRPGCLTLGLYLVAILFSVLWSGDTIDSNVQLSCISTHCFPFPISMYRFSHRKYRNITVSNPIWLSATNKSPFRSTCPLSPYSTCSSEINFNHLLQTFHSIQFSHIIITYIQLSKAKEIHLHLFFLILHESNPRKLYWLKPKIYPKSNFFFSGDGTFRESLKFQYQLILDTQ